MLFSSSIVYSFQCHGVQHARFSRPLPSPKVCSNSCPLSQWFYPTISSSSSFSFCLESYPASGSLQRIDCSYQVAIWNLSFSISPSNEYSGVISFRIDWLDLFAVQGTFKSLLQRHNSKASVLWPSAFFMIQLSHRYMNTEKTLALIIQTFVGKVMSLLF